MAGAGPAFESGWRFNGDKVGTQYPDIHSLLLYSVCFQELILTVLREIRYKPVIGFQTRDKIPQTGN